MRSYFAKAATMLAIPMSLFFTKKADAQSGIQGWDNKANAEFIVKDVQTKIKLGQIGTITRDVGCDCALLVRTTIDGRYGAYLTPAFFAQFNAESTKTWKNLPQSVKNILNKSRTDKNPFAVDGIKGHLQIEHGIEPAIVVPNATRCKEEFWDEIPERRLEDLTRN